jgi:hypothetical protein
MKAVCVSDDLGFLPGLREGHVPVTPGRCYPVLGMVMSGQGLSLFIRDDWGPGLVPAGLFELFDDEIPPDWEFRLGPGIAADSGADGVWDIASWGYPEFAASLGHWQDLVEGEGPRLSVEVFKAQVEGVSMGDEEGDLPEEARFRGLVYIPAAERERLDRLVTSGGESVGSGGKGEL